MSDVKIAIHHSWQENPELLHVQLMEPRQRCGLACLEMIIESQLGHHVQASEIFRRAESYGAINDHNDWWHPGQVRVLTSYGLVAWRRNWTAPSQDPEFFEENEGYDTAQMSAVKYQISLEADRRSLADKFLLSLHDSLELGNPVIVSVKSGFSDNKENHQVVISGYRAEDRMFFVHDPVQQSGPTVVPEHYLVEYANYWALFSYHA
ncbi:MAG: hypothetical protein QG658_36 [Patescibacteria group bacterium]|nr:hypothetical protein [Patescibacteria group bacterium]